MPAIPAITRPIDGAVYFRTDGKAVSPFVSVTLAFDGLTYRTSCFYSLDLGSDIPGTSYYFYGKVDGGELGTFTIPGTRFLTTDPDPTSEVPGCLLMYMWEEGTIASGGWYLAGPAGSPPAPDCSGCTYLFCRIGFIVNISREAGTIGVTALAVDGFTILHNILGTYFEGTGNLCDIDENNQIVINNLIGSGDTTWIPTQYSGFTYMGLAYGGTCTVTLHCGLEAKAGGGGFSCPAPTECEDGACCYTDGTCAVVTPLACMAAGGTYYGDGTDCDPNPCPQPSGACCDHAGNCFITSPTNCAAEGGTYQGDSTDCDPNPCEPPECDGAPSDCSCLPSSLVVTGAGVAGTSGGFPCSDYFNQSVVVTQSGEDCLYTGSTGTGDNAVGAVVQWVTDKWVATISSAFLGDSVIANGPMDGLNPRGSYSSPTADLCDVSGATVSVG